MQRKKTVLKNFRLSRHTAHRLKTISRAKKQSQTAIVVDALERTYKWKP
jgi:predicted transcriptional regulator